jgi:glycosyltransferase involved in cell wall biosynthesis
MKNSKGNPKFIVIETPHKIKRPKIIGLMIIRNESLVLEDTLEAMSLIVDGIVVLDDASTDNSVDICLKCPKVLSIVLNTEWVSGLSGERYVQESIHRQKVLEVGKQYSPAWFLYMDADERIDGDIRNFMLENTKNKKISGIRLALYDAYLTDKDMQPYEGGKLYGFRKYFGQERRDIMMAWKNRKNVYFRTDEMARVPSGVPESEIIDRFYVQHYGKSLSIDHWEETCQFYIKYFPVFADKWRGRIGKAIHTKSDFGTKLMDWPSLKKGGGIKIG